MAAAPQALEMPQSVTSIKALAESASLDSIPSAYAFNRNPTEDADPDDPEFTIPIVDISILKSGTPEQRSQIIHDLVKICQEWGTFIAVNHGVPESLMKAMIDACHEFFKLPESEKQEIKSGNDGGVEIFNYGTSRNYLGLDKVLLWRDFLTMRVSPESFSLCKPANFSEVCLEFRERTREVALEIIKAISESLGLAPDYIYKEMNMDRGLGSLAANYYPVCPEPEHAIGIPHHTDHGLVTLLIQNEMNGLEVEHNGKWATVGCPPGVIFVNLADQMQIFTNGKYKSVKHRAMVNNKATRISVPISHGPSLDTIIAPLQELCERQGKAPMYRALKYKEYIMFEKSAEGYYFKARLEQILS